MNNKRLDLQGLRAIAVLAVMVFHMNEAWLPGGYLGVDVFFVLSGYLMALVLSRHQQIGWSEMKAFYGRRLARIAPAAFVVAAITAPFALFSLLPFDMRDFSASMVGLVTGILNIMVANNIGYFSPLADSQPLLHYWSLMVELHFYLLIPLVFWLSLRFRWSLLLLATILLVVSLGYAHYRVYQSPNDAYYLLASRAWEFLAGVILFLIGGRLKAEWLHAAAPWVGLAVVLWGFLFFDSSYSHPSLYTVPFILGVALLMWMPVQHPLGSALSSRPLVYLGDISYSVYLWHNVLIVLVTQKMGALQPLSAALIFVATLVLAHLTRIYIEQPFLQKPSEERRPFSKKLFYIPLLLFLVVFGGYGFDTKGFADFWKARVPEQSVQAYELYMAGKNYREVDKESACYYRFGSVNTEDLERVRQCTAEHGRGVLVLGDSHSIGVFRALNWARMEGTLQKPFVANLSKGGCGVTTEKQDCFFHQLKQDAGWIAENFKMVVYIQRGTGLLKKELDGEQGAVLDPVKSQAVEAFLNTLTGALDMVWLGPRIEANRYVNRYVSEGCSSGMEPDHEKGDQLRQLNRELQDMLQTSPIRFVEGQAYDLKHYGDCSRLYWRDRDHWTKQGIKTVSPRLLELLRLDQSK